jgi:imidazole glycerol-phosphate synthase subunit HisH
MRTLLDMEKSEGKSSNREILIIDYGMGNIGSIVNSLEYLGAKYSISSNKKDLERAEAFILPGVGAFAAAINNLKKYDLVEVLTQQVIKYKKPFFGICLGMQLLAVDSDELGFHNGLGWVNGHVRKIEGKTSLRVPHVGWNNLNAVKKKPLFANIEQEANFYFDHSHHFMCDKEWVAATFDYGEVYVAAIQKDNIWATQFHPEKSQRSGLKILRNYLDYIQLSN